MITIKMKKYLATIYAKLRAVKSSNKNEGNVIDGFSNYHLPLLLSYSRSGTNWIRYFIEVTTSRPTPGQKRLLGGSNYYLDRAHAGYRNIHNYQKVLLIVRNYKECIVRHHGMNLIKSQYSDVVNFLNDLSIEQPASWYMKNIMAFDEFSSEKLVIYYEDLIREPDKNLRLIGEFLDVDNKEVNKFILNLSEHREKSINAYTSNGHESITRGKASALTYHSGHLTNQEKKDFDKFFRSMDAEVFYKYLSMYETK